MNGLGMLAGMQGFAAGIPLGERLVGADLESRKLAAEQAAAKARGLQEAFKTQMELERYWAERGDKDRQFNLARWIAENDAADKEAARVAGIEEKNYKRSQDEFNNTIQAGQYGMEAGRYAAAMDDAARTAAEFQRIQDYRTNRQSLSMLVNQFMDPNQPMAQADYDALRARFPKVYESLRLQNPEQHEQAIRAAAQDVAAKRDQNAFNRPQVLASINAVVQRDLNAIRGTPSADGSPITGVQAVRLAYDPSQPGTFSVGVRVQTEKGGYDSWVSPGRGIIGPRDLNQTPPAEAAVFRGDQFVRAVRGLSVVSNAQRDPQVVDEMRLLTEALNSGDTPEKGYENFLAARQKTQEGNTKRTGDLRSQIDQVLKINQPEDIDTYAATVMANAPEADKAALAQMTRKHHSALREKAYEYANQHPGSSLEEALAYARANVPNSFEAVQNIWTGGGAGTPALGGTVYSGIPPGKKDAVKAILLDFKKRTQGMDPNGLEFRTLFAEKTQQLQALGVR